MSRPAHDQTLTVLRPPASWPGFGLRELWLSRGTVAVLLRRMLLARYRQAVLGFAWIIIQPLVLTVIITVFVGLVMGRGERFGLPFPVFLFTAWLVWRPFQRVIGEGGNSIAGSGALLKRVYLPKAVFPVTVTIATLVDFAALLVALLVMLVLYGIAPGPGVLAMPIVVAIMYATGMGTAFFFSATLVRFRDMEFVIPLVAQAWFWSSPIIYSSSDVPEEWRNLYFLNPLVVVIEGARWAMTQTPVPPIEAWVIGGASAATMLVLGYVYFRRHEATFADLV